MRVCKALVCWRGSLARRSGRDKYVTGEFSFLFVAPPGGEQCYLWQGGRCSAYRYEEAKARSGIAEFQFPKAPELELELIQTYMTQKPVLLVEIFARALRVLIKKIRLGGKGK